MASRTKDKDRFVCRVPLSPSEAQKHVLLKRMRLAHRWYNLVLTECIKRVSFIKANHEYQRLLAERRKLKNVEKDKSGTESAALKAIDVQLKSFRAAIPGLPNRAFLTPSDLVEDLKTIRESFVPTLGAQPANTLTKRAFEVAERWLFAKGGRPRRRRGHEWVSVNGNQHIKLIPTDTGYSLRWGKRLVVPLWINLKDVHTFEALESRAPAIEMLYDGKTFAANVILDGKPKPVVKQGEGVVGVDMGVSTVAVVAEGFARVYERSKSRTFSQSKLLRLERKVARQYDARKQKGASKQERRTRRSIARMQYKDAQHRKHATNLLAKEVVALGAVHLEKLEYAPWQKRWGRTTGLTAPGALVARMKALGTVVEVPTYSTALSQTCICGAKKKKLLSERTHECPSCGLTVHRDLLSAYLVRFAGSGKLDLDAARGEWHQGARTLLSAGSSEASSDKDSSCLESPASEEVMRSAVETLAAINSGNATEITRELPASMAARGGWTEPLAGDAITRDFSVHNQEVGRTTLVPPDSG